MWLLIEYSESLKITEFNFENDLINYFNINIQQCDDYTDAMTFNDLIMNCKYYEIEIVEIKIDDNLNKSNVEIKTSKQLINK
jgi:FlaG/FlaF family flagellin (archaellin)